MFEKNSKIQALDDGVWREATILEVNDEDREKKQLKIQYSNFKESHAIDTVSHELVRKCVDKRQYSRSMKVPSLACENLILKDQVIFVHEKKDTLGTIILNDSFNGLVLAELESKIIQQVKYEEIKAASNRPEFKEKLNGMIIKEPELISTSKRSSLLSVSNIPLLAPKVSGTESKSTKAKRLASATSLDGISILAEIGANTISDTKKTRRTDLTKEEAERFEHFRKDFRQKFGNLNIPGVQLKNKKSGDTINDVELEIYDALREQFSNRFGENFDTTRLEQILEDNHDKFSKLIESSTSKVINTFRVNYLIFFCICHYNLLSFLDLQ